MAAARLTILVVLALCASAVVAHAEPRLRVAVLGLEVIGDADMRSTAVAHEITEGMRARARIGNGPYEYAPSSERELIDEKIITMCDNEAPTCMSAIAKAVGADVLVYGKLDRQDRSYRLQLHLLDATTKKKLNRISATVPVNASTDAMRAAAKRAYDDLAGEIAPSGGTIEIVANVEDGTVYVDNTQTEVLTDGKATLKVPEGHYTVAVEAAGKARKELRVDVKSNETIEQRFALVAAGGETASPRVHDDATSSGTVWKYGAYITGGAAGAMLVWTMTDFVRWRLQASDVGSVTLDPNLPGDPNRVGGDDCNGPAPGPRVVDDPNGTFANLCRIKNRQFTTAIVTGVLAAVAVSAYIGYRVTRPEPKKSAATEAPITLRPSLSPHSASAVFELRW